MKCYSLFLLMTSGIDNKIKFGSIIIYSFNIIILIHINLNFNITDADWFVMIIIIIIDYFHY